MDPRQIFPAGWFWLLLGASTLWADPPVLQSARVQNQRFSFVFKAQTNLTYSVQYATTLTPPNWSTALSVAGSNAPVTFADTNGMGQTRFYRVTQESSGGGGGGDGAGTVPASEVRSLASDLYDQIQQQQQLQQTFDPAEASLFFSAFGIPTVASTNDSEFEASVTAQHPFMMDYQARAVANGVGKNWYVTWDSFLAQMAEFGVAGSSDQPLSRAYLTTRLLPLLTKDKYQYSEVLPAMVMALGRERALRFGGTTDPVLGDDLLDPFQFSLMAYAWAAAEARPGLSVVSKHPLRTAFAHPRENPIPTLTALASWALRTFGPDAAKDEGLKWLSEQVDITIPIGKIEACKAVVCASIVLYSYEVQVTCDPEQIWQKSDPPSDPYESKITATVNFNFRQDLQSLPSSIATWAAGCDIPPNGPQDNVDLGWEVTGELPQHGKLVNPDLKTWNGGQAKATYKANDEPVPPVFQPMGGRKWAVGFVRLQVKNVVPKWASTVAVVQKANKNAGAGYGSLNVCYYPWPQLTLDMDAEFYNTEALLDSHILATGCQLQLVNNGTSDSPNYAYQGQVQETYGNFHCALQGDDPGIMIESLVGDKFQATIPAPRNLTLDTLKVMVDVGKPHENVVVVVAPNAPPVPLTYYWFVDMWAIAHNGDAVQDPTSPYMGRYAITGWQGPDSPLTRKFSGPASDVTEQTKFTLTGTPGQ